MHILNILERAAAIAVAAALAVFSPAGHSSTQETRLDNGMRVIVKPDRRAPVVVSMVWYQVGSVDEENGRTGVAHLLEHLMFKGTKAVKAGEFSRIIAAAGGRENAFTSRDSTAYFETLQSSQLDLALKLEADRMHNLLFSPEEFAKELKVVMEERRWRLDDRPRALVFEALYATALIANPYRNPVIGWMSDLQSMTVNDASAFYRRWYAPNNAVLVVVGDVDPNEVFALAQKHFGAIPSRTLPVRKPQTEPVQLGERRVTVKAPAELPYVVIAFQVPPLRDAAKDWEPYALDMLSAVLDGNAAARLNRTLVRNERVANSVGAGYDGISRGPGLFYLIGVATRDHTAEDVEQGFRREMAKIIEKGVTEEELNRAKAQAIAAQVYQRDSMFYQAQQIGSLEMTGIPYTTIDLQLEKLRKVTPQQVQDVARKYFRNEALTVVKLDPQPLPKKRTAPPADMEHVR
ncbi:MAG: M16 family metallopeptidase [Burkholderiales bacterium]